MFIPSIIKSIQRGVIHINASTTSNTATISSVVTANSVIRALGNKSGASGADSGTFFGRVALTNSTTVTAFHLSTANDIDIAYEVIEYYSGIIKSNQAGTIALASGTNSNTATISSVTTGKTDLSHLGVEVTVSLGGGNTDCFATLTLTNATTITADRGNSGVHDIAVGWQALEFR